MGTWGPKPFDNDAALDFVDRLSRYESPTPIQRAIKKAKTSKSPDAGDACHAIAAAELMAYARGHGRKDIPENGSDWCDDIGFESDEGLVDLAVTALNQILEESELADLWQDTGAGAWRRQVRGLISRLARKPKRRARPPVAKPPDAKEVKRHLTAIRKAGSEVFLEKRRPNILSVDGQPTKAMYEHAGQLSSLTVLGLAAIEVKGKTIAPLAKLPAVRKIDLQQSRIDEQAFKVLGQLGSLEALKFFYAKFPGGAPRHLKSLQGLREFDAKFTPLTDLGLAGVSQSANLKEVKLSKTRVTDVGMTHLAGLQELEDLNLSGTRVTDKGLRHLAGLTRLQRLDLSDTRVTGKGMKYLGAMEAMTLLDLAHTRVDSPGLKHLRGMTKIAILDLTDTEISNAGLKHLEPFKRLFRLSVAQGKITDAGLKAIAMLKNLRELDLRGTGIRGEGLEHLPHRKLISKLNLSGSRFGDDGIQVLHRFPNLKMLGLGDTRVSDGGLAGLPQFECLRKIDLSHTEIGDSTARTLSGIATLSYVDLTNTSLTDDGMAELVKLPELRTLSISGTKVTEAGIKLFKKHKSIWQIDK